MTEAPTTTAAATTTLGTILMAPWGAKGLPPAGVVVVGFNRGEDRVFDYPVPVGDILCFNTPAHTQH